MEYVVSFSEGGQTFEMWAVTLDAARAIADALLDNNAPDVEIAIRFPRRLH